MTEAAAPPWAGRTVPWTIDGEEHVAHYNPAEVRMMEIARERGCTTSELEVLHLVKALCDGTIIDAEAKP